MSTAKNPQIRYLGLTLVLLLIPFSLYYLFYVTHQERYFTNRNYRLLNLMSDQISGRIEALCGAAGNASKAGPLDARAQEEPADDTSILERVNKGITSAIKAIRNEGGSFELVDGSVKVRTASSSPADHRIAMRPEVLSESGQSILKVSFSGVRPIGQALGESGETGRRSIEFEFAIKMVLGEVIERFVSQQVFSQSVTDAPFDLLVIGDPSSGSILFQNAPAGISLSSLKDITETKSTAGTLEEVRVNGTSYKLFSQPIQLDFSTDTIESTPPRTSWVVYGLVSSTNFRTQTLSISYSILVIYLFAALFIATSWPLLKLRFMGPFDRLRIADVYQTAFALMVLTTLITLAALDYYVYYSVETELDTGLEELAQTVRTNFNSEVQDVLQQLDAFNKRYARWATGEIGSEGKIRSPEAGVVRPVISNALSPGENLVAQDDPYPYFHTVFWCNRTGQQIAKWTIWKRGTPLIDVGDRGYFKAIVSGESWRFNASSESTPQRTYYIEPLYSRTTGESEAVIVEPFSPSDDPFKKPASDPSGVPVVAAIDTRIVSLGDPVLPAGFGYCVIDANGKALFHSDTRKSLWENVFDECDRNKRLLAAVESRVTDTFDSRYQGRDFRMCVTTVDSTPWSLVVFRDKSILRAANVELLILSLLAFTLYSLSLLALVAFVHAIDRRERVRWIWPDESRRRDYCAAIVMNLLFAIGYFRYALRGPSAEAVNHALVISIAALLVNIVIFKCAPIRWLRGVVPSSPRQRKGRATRWYYLVSLMSLLVVAGVLPTTAFFRAAYNDQMRILVKHGQVAVARGMRAREERIRQQYSHENCDLAPNNDTFADRRLNGNKPDVYTKFFFDTEVAESGQAADARREPPSIWDWIVKRAPIIDRPSLEMKGLRDDASSDDLWRWGPSPKADRFFLTSAPSRAGAKARGLTIESQLPLLRVPTEAFWYLIFLALPALLLAVLRFATQRIFMLDLDEPVVRYDTSNAYRNASCNRLIIGQRDAGKAELDGMSLASKPHRFDFAERSRRGDWSLLESELLSTPADAAIIVIANFDARCEDPDDARAKQEFMKTLARGGYQLLVMSQTDPRLAPSPARHPAASTNGNGAAAAPALAESPWADYFQDFLVFRASDLADGRTFLNDTKWCGYLPQRMGRKPEASTCTAPVCRCPILCAERAEWGRRKWRSRLSLDFVRVVRTVRTRTRLSRTLARECRGHSRLHEVCEKFLGTYGYDFADSDYEVMMHRLAVHTRPDYKRIWAACSPEERFTLFRLAEDKHLSLKNPYIVRLLRLGLMKFDPNLQLMNESFRRFVLGATRSDEVSGFEKKPDSAWQILKAPFVTVLIAVALFLFVTQRELYDWTITTMTALTAGVPLLLKLVDVYARRGADPAAKV